MSLRGDDRIAESLVPSKTTIKSSLKKEISSAEEELEASISDILNKFANKTGFDVKKIVVDLPSSDLDSEISVNLYVDFSYFEDR